MPSPHASPGGGAQRCLGLTLQLLREGQHHQKVTLLASSLVSKRVLRLLRAGLGRGCSQETLLSPLSPGLQATYFFHLLSGFFSFQYSDVSKLTAHIISQ